MAHSPKDRIWEEILFGIKADVEEAKQSESVGAIKEEGSSCVPVPQEENGPGPANLNPLKPQLDLNTEGQCPSVVPVLGELPTNKSRLTPLAARAALASLVSTAYEDGTNGVKLDDHHMSNNVSVVENCSSEDPSTLVPVAGETIYPVKKLFLDETDGSLKPQLEESNKLDDARVRAKRPTTERKSAMLERNSRVTRSSIQKATGSAMDAKDIPRSSSMDGEGFSLPSILDENANLTFNGGEEDNSTQMTRSGNSKKSKPKKTTVTQKQESSEMEAEMCIPADKAGEITPALAVELKPTKGKAAGKSVKRKLVEPHVPGRVTRSAAQKVTTGNSGTDAQFKTRDEQLQERVLKKTRRSIASTELENEEDLTEEESVLAQKKKTISAQIDSEGHTSATEKAKAKASTSTKRAQQAGGKSTGSATRSRDRATKSISDKQNKKPSSSSKQERRFSPRLNFLPRTRSQVKS